MKKLYEMKFEPYVENEKGQSIHYFSFKLGGKVYVTAESYEEAEEKFLIHLKEVECYRPSDIKHTLFRKIPYYNNTFMGTIYNPNEFLTAKVEYIVSYDLKLFTVKDLMEKLNFADFQELQKEIA